jgi:hypothetical protein
MIRYRTDYCCYAMSSGLECGREGVFGLRTAESGQSLLAETDAPGGRLIGQTSNRERPGQDASCMSAC